MSTPPKPGPPAEAPSAQAGIPGDAFAFVAKRLALAGRELTKPQHHQLIEAMKGLNGDAIVELVTLWKKRSGMRLSLDHVLLLLGFLREHHVKDVFDGLLQGFAHAAKMGKPVLSPMWCAPHITQLASDPARKELRVGGHN